MASIHAPSTTASTFQIRFDSSLFADRAVAFPCDERGQVDMDQLSEAGRRDYFFARIMTRLARLEPQVGPACGH